MELDSGWTMWVGLGLGIDTRFDKLGLGKVVWVCVLCLGG